MKLVGLLLPLLLIMPFVRPADGVTHVRYYLGPAIAAVLAIVAVLTTEPGPTPDFWVGLSASLGAVAAAGLVLVIQGFLPLEWWVKDSGSPQSAPPADPAA